MEKQKQIRAYETDAETINALASQFNVTQADVIRALLEHAPNEMMTGLRQSEQVRRKFFGNNEGKADSAA